MVQIKSESQKFGINLPTRIEEITNEYLQECVKNVEISENYAIIALVYTVKLSELCFTLVNPKAKSPTTGITPLIVKFKVSKDNEFKHSVGNIAIMSNNDIERGYYINVPSAITISNTTAYLKNDSKLCTDIQTGKLLDEEGNKAGNTRIKMIEFKIIPVCDIHGSYPINNTIKDQFCF